MSPPRLPSLSEKDRERIRRDLLDSAHIGTFRYTLDGLVIYMDPGTFRALEIEHLFPDPDDVVGKPLSELFSYVDKPGRVRDRVLQDGRALGMEYHYRTIEGREKWSIHDAYLVRDSETGERCVQVIAREITRQKLAERQLQQANHQLEASYNALRTLDELRNNLLANMSHDLRSPLVSVRGYAELMQEGVSGPVTDQQRKQLGVIIRNVDRVSRLIEDLLDFARLQSGAVRLELGPCWLNRVVREAVVCGQPDAKHRGLTLLEALCDEELVVRADEGRLTQILTNLLDNALKFTPRGGEIRISTYAGEGRAGVIVQDDGPGVAKDQLPMVFKRLFQVETGSSRRVPGLGIGLATCKQLVEQHGGVIRASSSPGRGFRVTFELPLDDISQTTEVAAPEQPPSAAGLRVLVVDDDAESAQFIQDTLRLNDVEVLAAASGSEALDLLARRPVDLVLLELAMPGMSGLEVCRILRRDAALARLKVVMLSAATNRRQGALAAGADDFLCKPFGVADLLVTVARHRL